MLRIFIPGKELYDDESNTFILTKPHSLQLEHSLVSLSKWESKWCKPFLTQKDKTRAESVDYVRCMTITQNVDPEAYNYLTDKNITEVTDYIAAPMTATTFRKDDKRVINREIVTSEVVYYWMINFNIPFDPCEKWHLNRLLTLINVCNLKSQPKKKMSRGEIIAHNKALNAARRNNLNSAG